MHVKPDHIPSEIQSLESFMFWKNIRKGDGKMTKSPVSSAGIGIAHNNTDELMPFELAKERLSKASGLGLGISLLDGVKVNVETHTGYLWCLDFDGFAEPNSDKVDYGVTEFIDAFPSYIEISPSGTGFKYFFVCDRPPQSKSKIKFGPSDFADEYPNVTKYAHREIEVFSRSFYLALTGQVFSSSTAEIKFVSSHELEAILEKLNHWAKSTGGSGTTASSNAGQKLRSTVTSSFYSKLTKPCLEAVLAFVDHVDEQVWTNTANALARVYGEDGRSYFQTYSKGDYASTPYAGYNSDECHRRFNRALNELKGKPDGFGMKHLIEIASNHSDWQNPKLEYEVVNPFDVLSDDDETGVDSTDPLEELQRRFCIIDTHGDIRILDRDQINSACNGNYKGDISFYKKFDGELMMKRFLETLPISSKPNVVIPNFWVNPLTLLYDQTAFTPNVTSPTTLNYWTGHTISPIANNNYAIIDDYLLKVICNDDSASHWYLVRFLAHMLQFPEEKPGIVPVLIGGQGTGKGVFFQLLKAIWSKTTLLVSDVNAVVGQFNAALERHYVVCMDEALFSGDKKSLDRLKSIVTEPTIRIEEKYQPARSIDSLHRFFAATNHDQFAHVEKDERRFFFLRVSPAHKQDVDYFSRLCDSFSDGQTLEGFVAFLLSLDLAEFNIRERPKTTEYDSQRIKSLDKFERYWNEVLLDSNFGADDSFIQEDWEAESFISTKDLVRHYKKYYPKADKYEPIQTSYISQAIIRLCPSAKPVRRTSNNKQQRGFDLPDIQTARSEFDKHFNIATNWDE